MVNAPRKSQIKPSTDSREQDLLGRVYLGLTKYLLNDEDWSRSFKISLSDATVQRELEESTGLRWTTIRQSLRLLCNERLISVAIGSGRGNLTSIEFIAEPSKVLSTYVENNPDAKQTISLEAEIDRLKGLARQAVIGDLSWWTPDLSAMPNELLGAPTADYAFADDVLIGRDENLIRLAQNLRSHHFVALIGPHGIGKTHLIAWFVRTLLEGPPGGLRIYWARLSERSTLDEQSAAFLSRAVGKSTPVPSTSSLLNKTEEPSSQAYAFLNELRKNLYLIVFDEFETVLDDHGVPNEEGFQSFLELLSDHQIKQSRVLVVGQWVPRDKEGRAPVPVEIDGLDLDAGERFLRHLGVDLPQSQSEAVVKAVDGNPLVMQMLRDQLLRQVGSVSHTNTPLFDHGKAAQTVREVVNRLDKLELLAIGLVSILGEDASEPIVRRVLSACLKATSQRVSAVLDDLAHTKFILKYHWSETHGARHFNVSPLIYNYVLESALSQEDVTELRRCALAELVSQCDESGLCPEDCWIAPLRQAIAVPVFDAAADILIGRGVGLNLLSSGRLGQLRLFLEALIPGGKSVRSLKPDSILQKSKSRGIESHLVEAVRLLGQVHWRQGRLVDAEFCFRLLITDPFIPTAANVAALAGVRLDQGHHKDGLKTARSALELAVQTEDPFAEMEAWGWIGYALDETGPVGDCLEAYERAIALSRELEELPSESITQARLGMILWKTGEFEASRPHFETAVELAEKIGDPYYLGLAQGDLGHYFMDKEDSSLNDLNRAIECYQTALDIHRSAGVRRGEGFWLGQLGRTRIRLEDFVTAKAWLEEAIQIHLEVGDLTAIPRHLQYLAQLHLRKPDDTLAAQATAVAYYKVAIERLNERGSSIEMQNIRNELEAFLNAKSRETRDDLIVRAQVIQNVIIQYLDYQKGSLP